jgi:hypothetical protein
MAPAAHHHQLLLQPSETKDHFIRYISQRPLNNKIPITRVATIGFPSQLHLPPVDRSLLRHRGNPERPLLQRSRPLS